MKRISAAAMRPDINLLIVFDAVAETKSVTVAARKLALSQSAVSHALNRLRDVLGDPLFTRCRKGLLPTAWATSMIAPVRDVLACVDALMANRSFDPATVARRFRLGASDYATLTLVPNLVRRLRKLAPNILLEIVPVGADTLAQMEDGRLDLSFWGTAPPPAPFITQELFREHYVGLMATDHPLMRGKARARVTVSQYLAYPHITVSLRDPGQNVVDQCLSKLGRSRKIMTVSHSFGGNMQCLRDTDLIATLPSRLCAGDMMQGLVKFKLPILVPDYGYSVCWHRRVDGDAGVQWLKGRLA